MKPATEILHSAIDALEWADNAHKEGAPIQVSIQTAITELRELLARSSEPSRLADLVLELADAVDNAADDVGGSRPQLDILRDAVKEAQQVTQKPDGTELCWCKQNECQKPEGFKCVVEHLAEQHPYSIDADDKGIRARVADAISGALNFGAQGINCPPENHWLTQFWNIGAQPTTSAQPLTDEQVKAIQTKLSRMDSGLWSRGGTSERVLLQAIWEAAHGITASPEKA